MKFISLIFFVAALSYTWSLSRIQMPVTQSVHVGIQDDLKNIIQNYVENNLEGAKDVRFERMWTETVSKTQVKAQFIYSFMDEQNTRIEIDGYATLNKISEDDTEVKFSFDQLMIQNQSITFDEPMKITAGAGDLDEMESTSEEQQGGSMDQEEGHGDHDHNHDHGHEH
ncbi:hypothetical protein GW916_07730 [bacterium]|nr:hypothetical protein [bacterium]